MASQSAKGISNKNPSWSFTQVGLKYNYTRDLKINCSRTKTVFLCVGEILKITHVVRGVDAEGVLLVDMVINGFIPVVFLSSTLHQQV